MSYLILAVVGIAAGAINVLSGGGSMLTVPAMIFLGLEGPVANGTNRVAILFQNIFAVYGFKQSKLSHFGLSLKLALLTLPGAVAGAFVSTRLSNEVFNKVLAGVLVVSLATLYIKRKRRDGGGAEGKPSIWLYPAMFGIGFYGGFIQIGVGFLIMAALYNLLRTNLVRVNMHKVFIVLIYTLPTLVVFVLCDKVDWKMGICLAAGNSTGGYLGSRFQNRIGEKWIKVVTTVAVLAMAGKLMFFR